MIKWIYRSTRVLGAIILKVFFRAKAEFKYKVPQNGPMIICSNHINELDMFLIGMEYKPFIRFMAKKELFKVPLMGTYIKWLGAFSVDRSKADMNSIRTALDILNSGGIIGIFPEGSRSKKLLNNDSKKRKAKSGAILISIKTGAPILPVGIKADYRLFSKTNVVFGEPYVPNIGEDHTAEELENATTELMNKIYNLTR